MKFNVNRFLFPCLKPETNTTVPFPSTTLTLFYMEKQPFKTPYDSDCRVKSVKLMRNETETHSACERQGKVDFSTVKQNGF